MKVTHLTCPLKGLKASVHTTVFLQLSRLSMCLSSVSADQTSHMNGVELLIHTTCRLSKCYDKSHFAGFVNLMHQMFFFVFFFNTKASGKASLVGGGRAGRCSEKILIRLLHEPSVYNVM